MGVMDQVVTWRAVADELPPDIVAAILAGPPPPLHVRAGRALSDWWLRPRGTAAVYAAVGNSFASSVRIAMGGDEEIPGLRTLNDYAARRRG
jgi:hypothetical protein